MNRKKRTLGESAIRPAPRKHDYPWSPVPFTQVAITGGFWWPRLTTNRDVTVGYVFRQCEETGRITNFEKAGHRQPGTFKGEPFDDSDVFKAIEGAAYTLATRPDRQLAGYLDELIAKIAAAQEPDGYLYTARTIQPDQPQGRASPHRWLNERGALGGGDSHELYNAGHLYEAAVAHYEATGKRSLLDVALKNADLITSQWGPDKLDLPSGHPEIEIGLVKLYRVTGAHRYLDLAQFLLDCRGRSGDPYYADHLPVGQQTEAVGHAVRTVYMYAAMADVAVLTGHQDYSTALDRLWENVVSRRLYLTGGIGARPNGETFGDNYELPNQTAYAETCAAIANVFWNHRMFLLHGHARYLDVLERVLYNGFLAGVALSGDRFFYPNPLAADGVTPFNHGSPTRSPWFGCSCCPVNIVRFLPALSGYVYATRGETIYVNLYMTGTAELPRARLIQQTDYPWDGHVKLTVEPKSPGAFTLALRIPGWAQGRPVPSDLYRYPEPAAAPVTVKINGQPVPPTMDRDYICLTRRWMAGDTIELNLPMPIRRVLAHEAVAANTGRAALERGPVVYCVEGGHALDAVLPDDLELTTEQCREMLGGVTVIRGNGLTAIPYYAWGHRGPGEMTVWMRRR